MPKNITFTLEEKKYTLEYTLESVVQMELEGFNSELLKSAKNFPCTIAFMLLEGAFYANHRDLTKDEIHDIAAHLTNKEALFRCLTEMFNECVNEAFGDSGNSMWTFSGTLPTNTSTNFKS